MSTNHAERARHFHRLHDSGQLLVLPNVWDAASARIVEEAGAKAIATTSAGIAWSLGHADGEQLPLQELIAACRRIGRVVAAPLSVDIERGYGQTPADVAAVVGALLEFGVVGVNIEDGVDTGASTLTPASVLGERIAAIRTTAERVGVNLFINARTNTYFVPNDDARARIEETVRRAGVYVEAGADGVFVPGITRLDEIAEIAERIPRPLNVYAGFAGVPPTAELMRAGVRRVSLGCGPLQAVMAQTRRIAREALDQGSYKTMTDHMLPAGEANQLFRHVDLAGQP
ncbi:MAG: isocitrate lyase/phosphoenolpyruvate mutase family protein [Dokdonella sp.]